MKSTYTLLTALSMLLLPSCSQDEPEVTGGVSDADEIIFHTSMPGVTSRSYDNIQMGDLQGGFSVAAHDLDYEPQNVGDAIPLYFEKVEVTKTEGMGTAYRSDLCKWPDNKDGKDGKLRFYAFYPSLETLREKSGLTDPTYFLLHDISAKQNNGILYSYRIGNFKINQDILRHVDFVAASTVGSKTDNLYSGVTLEFTHKLSRIDFKAWSSNPSYAVEIAGVRINGAIVSTTFNMEGNWIYGSATEKNVVEYIYRKGDTVVTLDGSRNNSAATATSIMGNGGWAMIIPGNQGNNVGKYTAWNKTSNGAGVYFSVLMRVIDNTDKQGLILYPYVDGATITGNVPASNKNSVYLVVEKTTGIVKERVYKNKTTKQYFSDATLRTPYTVPEGMEIREYGWAAIPLTAQQFSGWDAGKTYTYTLDYTNGIGVHAHDDDAAGKAIITSLSIASVEENSSQWVTPYEEKEIELEKGKDFIQE